MAADGYHVVGLTYKKLEQDDGKKRKQVLPPTMKKVLPSREEIGKNRSDVGEELIEKTDPFQTKTKFLCSAKTATYPSISVEVGQFTTPDSPDQISETDINLMIELDRAPSPGQHSVGSSDEGWKDTSSSGEEEEGELDGYCNIAVLLRTFSLYFKDPTSAFNAWIDRLSLHGFIELRHHLDKKKIDVPQLAIKMFLSEAKTQRKNCFGQSFERLIIFDKRDNILDHGYQRWNSETDLIPAPNLEYKIIHGMIYGKLTEGCPLQEAVNAILNDGYYPHRTLPYLPFDVQKVYITSSQLPNEITYFKGVTYCLAGILYHRRNKTNKDGDDTGDHFVVRAYDPVRIQKKKRWRYSSSGKVNDAWEDDPGDPISNEIYIYKLSVVVYIVADPPEERNHLMQHDP